MAQVVVDELLTSYQRSGTGQVVLLLHGWGDNATGLQNIFANLSKKYDVIAPDLPGFGSSEIPKNQPWNLNNYAEFIQHFLEKIGVQHIFAIIGHSNGGAITITAVSQGLLKPESIILLASSGIRAKQKQPIYKKVVFSVGKLVSKLLPKNAQQKIRKNVYERSGSDIFVAPQLESTFREIIRQDIQEDAQNITKPTLLIYGDKDNATPVEFGKIFNRHIVGSKLVIVEGAGHFVHIDQPTIIIKEINRFLETGE